MKRGKEKLRLYSTVLLISLFVFLFLYNPETRGVISQAILGDEFTTASKAYYQDDYSNDIYVEVGSQTDDVLVNPTVSAEFYNFNLTSNYSYQSFDNPTVTPNDSLEFASQGEEWLRLYPVSSTVDQLKASLQTFYFQRAKDIGIERDIMFYVFNKISIVDINDPNVFLPQYPFGTYIEKTQGLHGFPELANDFDARLSPDVKIPRTVELVSPISGKIIELYIDQFGNTVITIENSRFKVRILHGTYDSVQIGDWVFAGQRIGIQDNIGYTFSNNVRCNEFSSLGCGEHSHIEVYDQIKKEFVDPSLLLGLI